jgi:hypothetical protein
MKKSKTSTDGNKFTTVFNKLKDVSIENIDEEISKLISIDLNISSNLFNDSVL